MKHIYALVLKLEVIKGREKSVFSFIKVSSRYWLTGFTPVHKPGSIHHIIVAGCNKRPPKTKHNVWNCGVNGNPVLEPTYPSFVVGKNNFHSLISKIKIVDLL